MGKNVIISTLPNISQNYLPKVNTSNIFANSLVYDNGTNVMVNTTATHADYTNARLVVNNTGNSYLEVRGNGGQGALVLTTSTSTTSNYPTIEIFNSGNFGIVGYRPGVVSSNYLMYYDLGSSTNRALSFQTEGVNRLVINQNGNIDMLPATSGGGLTIGSSTTAFAVGLYLRNDGNTAGNFIGTARTANQFITGSSAGDMVIGLATGENLIVGNGQTGTSEYFRIASTGAATFSSSVSATGNAATTASFNANNTTGGSGTSQYYINFTAGATTIGRIFRGNGASGLVANGLNIDNFEGFQVRLNQLGGSGGTFNVTGGAATFSSSVTATQFNAYGSGTNDLLYFDAGVNTDYAFKIVTGADDMLTLRRQHITQGGRDIISFGFSGNVGIGTNNPTGAAGLALALNGGASQTRIALKNNTTGDGTGDGFQILLNTDGEATLEQRENAALTFNTNNTERMRITSGGQLLLGNSTNGGYNISVYSGVSAAVATANGLAFRTTVTGTTGQTDLAGILWNDYSGNDLARILPVVDNTNASAATHVRFFTHNGTSFGERMRITSGGNVGIGTTGSSTVRLFTAGSGTSSAASAFIAGDVGGNTLFQVRNDGNIGTGLQIASPYNNTSASSANLIVFTDGTLGRSTSSLKYKKNVRDYDKGLDIINKMRPVYYNGKNDGDKIFAGLIAEEVHELGLTEFVQYAEDGSPDAIAYQNMVALLTKAIQEQQKQIEEQKADIESLKALINK